MEEDIKGKFVTRTKKNGIKYKLYVPKNVNADTPVYTYAYGTGDPGIEKCVLENGSDSIFIMTIVNWDADLGNITMDIVDEVKQEFGITSTTVTPSGFSLGGFAGYETAAENIRRNPDCDPQTVFFIDTYGTIFYNPKLHLNDTDTINLFKENNTVFFALDHPLKTTDINKLYAEAGLNIIQVKCIGQEHGDINASFFTERMYDYMAGHALPKDGYVYYMYNKETREWEEIPYEEITTKDDVNSYLGIDTLTSNMDRLYKLPDITVKSNDKTLENYLNSIRKVLRNTTFFTANFNKASFFSTTQVPTAIPDIITEYFTMTSSLLNKIANKTTAIAKIAGEIELLDENMSSRAEHINNTALYAIEKMITTEVPVEHIENLNNVVLNQPTNNTSDDSNKESIVVEQLINIEESKQVPEQTPSTSVVLPNTNTSKAPLSTDDEQKISNKESSGANEKTEQLPSKQTSPVIKLPQEKKSIEEQFPKYDELYTSNDKIVYNYNDEYKVVLHHENGKITAVEHYYDYKTTEDATKAVEQLTKDYKDVKNFDKIVQKEQYIKVLFKEDMYKDISLDNFKEKYKGLEEVVEQL